MPPKGRSQEYTDEELKLTDKIINYMSGSAERFTRATNGKNYKSKQLKTFLKDNRPAIRTIINDVSSSPATVEQLVSQTPSLWTSLAYISSTISGPILVGVVDRMRSRNNIQGFIAASIASDEKRGISNLPQYSGDEASDEAVEDSEDSDYLNATVPATPAPAPVTPAVPAIGLDVETPTPVDPTESTLQQFFRDAPSGLLNPIISALPAHYKQYADMIRNTPELISEVQGINPVALVSVVMGTLTDKLFNTYMPTLSPFIRAVAGEIPGRVLGVEKKDVNKARQFSQKIINVFTPKSPSLGGVSIEELKSESPPTSPSLKLLTPPPLGISPPSSALSSPPSKPTSKPLKPTSALSSQPFSLLSPLPPQSTPRIMFTEDERNEDERKEKKKIAQFSNPSIRTGAHVRVYNPLLGTYEQRPARLNMNIDSKKNVNREQEAEMSLKNDLKVASAPGGLGLISSTASGPAPSLGAISSTASAPAPRPGMSVREFNAANRPSPKKPEQKKPEQKQPEEKQREDGEEIEKDEKTYTAEEKEFQKVMKTTGNTKRLKQIYKAMKIAKKPLGGIMSMLAGVGISLAEIGILDGDEDDDEEDDEDDPYLVASESLKNITSLQNGISRQKINYDATLFMKDINPPKDLLKPTQTDAQNDLFTMFNYRQDPLKDSVLLQADRGVQLLNATIYIDVDKNTNLLPTGSGTYHSNFSFPVKPINMDYFSRFENNKGYDDFSAGPMKFLFAQ